MLKDFSSKYFKELEGLPGHMCPIVFLQKYYPIRDLVPALVIDDLFESQQRVAIPLNALLRLKDVEEFLIKIFQVAQRSSWSHVSYRFSGDFIR